MRRVPQMWGSMRGGYGNTRIHRNDFFRYSLSTFNSSDAWTLQHWWLQMMQAELTVLAYPVLSMICPLILMIIYSIRFFMFIFPSTVNRLCYLRNGIISSIIEYILNGCSIRSTANYNRSLNKGKNYLTIVSTQNLQFIQKTTMNVRPLRLRDRMILESNSVLKGLSKSSYIHKVIVLSKYLEMNIFYRDACLIRSSV